VQCDDFRARRVNLNLPHGDGQIGRHGAEIEEQRFRLHFAEMLEEISPIGVMLLERHLLGGLAQRVHRFSPQAFIFDL
jgi:hypothetical protein